MPFFVSDAECSGCGHWWRAVVEEDDDHPAPVFGLECRKCGAMRGRSITLRVRFDVEGDAVTFARSLDGSDAEGDAEVIAFPGGPQGTPGP